MGQKITPTLWFDTEGEAAAAFYVSIFDDAELGAITRYDESAASVSGQPAGSALTVSFVLEGQHFLALNGGPQFTVNPSISFLVNCPTEGEVDELWDQLADGGEVLMPLDAYPFSERYGWVEDKYGVSWQLMFSEDHTDRTIVPALLFVGDRCGQAEAAVRFYTSVFDRAEIGDITRYGPGEHPDEEGTVKFAEFTLEGQRFAAMDSAHPHEFTFTEAVSFTVDCEDQDEVDYFWEALTADGGAAGQCGWLEDAFGVSWQITPTVLPELLAAEDEETASRVMEALLEMEKLDIAALKAAATST